MINRRKRDHLAVVGDLERKECAAARRALGRKIATKVTQFTIDRGRDGWRMGHPATAETAAVTAGASSDRVFH